MSSFKIKNSKLYIFFIIVIFHSRLINTESETIEPGDKDKIQAFLGRYGYIPNYGNGQVAVSPDELENYLRQFQYMAGINQTGKLDDETLRMMNTPRCSVSDTVGQRSGVKRRKRYAIQGQRWNRPVSLTYQVRSWDSRLGQGNVRRIISDALSRWSSVSAVNFREIGSYQQRNHIDIIFARGAHGDNDAFNGPNGILAHAFFPGDGLGGDAHFDADETWTERTTSGYNLLQVATHEFGHSLGLAHSNDRNAVMYAYYQGYRNNFQLGQDDINGIRYLYGSNRPPPAPTTTTTTTRRAVQTTTTRPTQRPSGTPNYCNNGRLDAITVVNGITYAFQGSNYMVINNYGVSDGYPRSINSFWRQLDSVDAALYLNARTSREIDYLYLFKGNQLYKYRNYNQLESGYPRFISSEFPGIPGNLNAALVWSGNGLIYFFQGSRYYRYSRDSGASTGYPRHISVWRGLPNSGVDAAFQWTNGRTYFFSGTVYYRFDDSQVRVDPYASARPTVQWWFGCWPTIQGLEGGGNEIRGEFQDAEYGGDQYRRVDENEGNGNAANRQTALYIYIYASSIFLAILSALGLY